MSASALTFRAGPDALALLRERGLRAADVDVVPGASGGAKWLALAGLDRFLFGEFLRASRDRPLHGIGSSIGSWRLACLAQRDPVAALDRGHHAYVHEQHYSSPKPAPAEVSAVLGAALDRLLGPTGVGEILAHPRARLHVITAEARGAAASARRGVVAAALGASAPASAASSSPRPTPSSPRSPAARSPTAATSIPCLTPSACAAGGPSSTRARASATSCASSSRRGGWRRRCGRREHL